MAIAFAIAFQDQRHESPADAEAASDGLDCHVPIYEQVLDLDSVHMIAFQPLQGCTRYSGMVAKLATYVK